jgi:5-methyltetrahydrofolate--homocysteine methyltransferase
LAKDVANSFDRQIYISGSVGPGTKLPSLLQISFDELYKNYYCQIECFINNGVDIIQIETCQDMLQTKIALKACFDVQSKLNKEVPIFIQATLQDNGQMLVGTSLETFIHTFNNMPIFAIGINCGSGPQSIEPYIKILNENTNKYISILPNAGLPVLKDNVMVYDLTPQEFAKTCANLATNYRINAIGGCCGTTCEFITELNTEIKLINKQPKEVPIKEFSYLTSLYSICQTKQIPPPLMIGERANVNGSKVFKELLRNEQWEEMVEICLSQQDEGSHAIDICLTSVDRDEVSDINNFIPLVNQSVSVPIMIDSTNIKAIETALKSISGKAIVNSVNFEHGEQEVIKYIELCRDYNAALVCLCIDENTMAKSFTEKKVIVERFISLCEKYQFPQEHIFIDCLTFSLSTGETEYRLACSAAIEMIKYISVNYPKMNTIMGVSNVSFGLKPSIRKVLNSVFLHECVKNGLSAAIVDTAKILPLNEIKSDDIQLCLDLIYNVGDPLSQLLKITNITEEIAQNASPDERLRDAVIKGRLTFLDEIISELIITTEPMDILNKILAPSMIKVGELFDKGKIQLPFVLKSAEIMKKAVDYIKPYMKEENTKTNTSMLIATVQGDVHDIGKNLVKIILSNNGYEVFDIGIKQTPQDIYDAVVKYKPSCIGLSALIIKSTEYMVDTLEYLKKHNVQIPIICGGAALNEEFVNIELKKSYDGFVCYGKDAFSGLNFIKGI